jgi:hypothetical protein
VIGILVSWLASALPAGAARPCAFSGATGPRSSVADRPHRLRFLTDVRAGAHRCFDRAVFEFDPPESTTPGYRLRYKDAPIREDGSSRPVHVEGNAFLVVRLTPARDTDLSDGRPKRTYGGPESVVAPGGTRIVEVRHVSSFEGTVKWAIGLDGRRPYRVTRLTSPPRLVVDVG